MYLCRYDNICNIKHEGSTYKWSNIDAGIKLPLVSILSCMYHPTKLLGWVTLNIQYLLGLSKQCLPTVYTHLKTIKVSMSN